MFSNTQYDRIGKVYAAKIGPVKQFARLPYWSEEVYNTCLGEVGFRHVEWQRSLTISEEGKQLYPQEFWDEVKLKTWAVGIKAMK